jgi:trigger factor
MAAAQLRAPLYEDKVVDFLFSKAEVTERKATRAQLEADLESEEGHVHGPGCGHDVPDAKPAKAKKAKAEAKPKPEEPAKGPVEKSSGKPKPAKPLKDAAPATAKATPAKAEAKPAAKKAPAKKSK